MADLSQIELNNDTYNLKDSECRQNLTALISVLSTILEEAAPESFPLYDTVSGNVAAITDGADDLPIKSLTAQIEPVQDLHGYDHPWFGGRKNLYRTNLLTTRRNGIDFSDNNGAITISGTATANLSAAVNHFGLITLPAGTYWCSGNPNTTTTVIGRLALYKKVDDTTYSVIAIIGTDDPNPSFTLTENTNVCFSPVVSNGKTIDPPYTYYPMICVSSETNTSFEPYANICPISGSTSSTTTISQDNNSNNQFTINWETQAGTIYGGSAKYNGDGTWTVTSNFDYGETNSEGKFQRLSSETPNTWSGATSDGAQVNGYVYCAINSSNTGIISGKEICNMYIKNSFSDNTQKIFEVYRSTGNSRLRIRDNSIWPNAVNGTQIATATTNYFADLYTQGITLQVTWELTEPTTYTITTEQLIKTFHGINNIWSNTGDVTVEYPVDTNLYINKKIQQALQ